MLVELPGSCGRSHRERAGSCRRQHDRRRAPHTTDIAEHRGRLYFTGMIRPALVSALLSLVFIARTTFVVDGVRYATLFDDAMISMRYARNLAGGHGLVWNVGQPAVEGYTNFLWTLWMALIHLLPIPESKIALAVMATGGVILLT